MHLFSLLALAISVVALVIEDTSHAIAYKLQIPPLDTNWTSNVGTNPWTEYPRPQLQRAQWLSLNGIWQYQNAISLGDGKFPPFGKALDRQIMIPSCVESAMSGTSKRVICCTFVWDDFVFVVKADNEQES